MPRRSPRVHYGLGRRLAVLLATAVLLSAVSTAAAPTALAADGDPDPSFGSGGLVTSNLGGYTWGYDVAVRPDGRIIVVGSVDESSGRHLFVQQLLPDGSTDASFGAAGVVVLSDVDSTRPEMVLRSDGRLLVADRAPTGLVVYQLLEDGTPDPSFGVGGKATSPVFPESIAGIGLQPDGRIVVGFRTWSGVEGLGVARFTPDGTVDTGFGANGAVTIYASFSRLTLELAVQPDGKILLGGYRCCYVPSAGFVVRLTPDGEMDPGFGVGGEAVAELPSSSEFMALAVQPDGKIVAGGRQYLYGPTWPPNVEWIVARYNPDGTPDASFGDSGITEFDPNPTGSDVVLGLALGGQWIYATGEVETYGVALPVARFDTSGALDVSFGTNGVAHVTVPDFGVSGGWSTAVQPDGRVVVAGGLSSGMAAARYLAADLVPPRLDMPDDIVVDGLTTAGAPVEFTVTADDDVDGPVPVACSPASGSTFPLGVTQVHCTASDAAGNTAEGDFTVYVRLLVTRTTKLTRDYGTTLVAGADGITLDCAGRTISGPGGRPPGESGILVDGRARVTIKRCQVTGFASGIAVVNSTRIELSGNTVSQNDERGILLVSTTASSLRDNVANRNAWEGVLLVGSNGNALTRNTASNNGSPEVYAGFALLEGSSSNRLEANTANDNGDVGFVIEAGSDNRLLRNTASENGLTGFEIRSGSTGNTLSENLANGNVNHGYLVTDSFLNRLDHNTAQTTGSEGFLFVAASQNTLEQNTANRNGSAGIDLREGSNGNVLTGNTANHNEDGIRVFTNSNGNSLANNVANENRSFGFPVFDNASANVLTGNTANRNVSCGMAAMWGATDNLFSNNVALNTADGMDIRDEVPGLNIWENNAYKTICTGTDC